MESNDVGKTVRLSHIINSKSGRSVIIAMDHGLDGAVHGLENVGHVLDRLFRENPDGVLLNVGMFRHYSNYWNGRAAPGLILGGDIVVNQTYPQGEYIGTEYREQVNPEYLIAHGADLVKVFLIFGQETLKTHADNLRFVSEVVKESSHYGLPVMVEPVFWGPGCEEKNQQKGFLEDACRISVELGADIIKAPFVPQPDIIEKVVANCPVPILMLGGSKKGLDDLFKMTELAIKAGAKGMVIGRNVWQHPEPDRVLRCLNQIIHDGISSEEVIALSDLRINTH